MNVNYDAEEWNLSFELTKEGTGDEAFEHLDSLCFFELIRIDPDLRERYFLSFPDFEKDEQGIRECLRDIIEDSNLKKRIKG